MKYIINIQCLLLLMVITLSSNSFAQGIRKDYTEMTNNERDALMSAYWALGNDSNQNGPIGGLVGEIGDFHNNHFQIESCNCPDPIHFNTQNLDVFLAWHRQASVELQRAMKSQLNNEWITIPYWDWTLSNSKNDALWGNDWLGPFNAAWELDRSANGNGGAAPTQSEIDGMLSMSNFFPFSDALERSSIHSWAHIWTGGIMGGGDSPKDPTFFFHHNMVDKIWADWYEIHGDCPGGCYTKTNMPRYDGTETNILGEQLASVDPEDIVDPRSLGIFYSDRVNSLATLDKYTVSNANTSSEKFGYRGKIEAKDGFLVPAGKNAEFRSCTTIELLPGFEAANGSVFEAKIDNDCNFSTAALVADNSENDTPNSVFEKRVEDIDALQGGSIKNYPNPFSGQTTIEYNISDDSPVMLVITDLTGKQIAVLVNNETKTKGIHTATFNGSDYPAGMYYYTIQAGNYLETKKMTLVK